MEALDKQYFVSCHDCDKYDGAGQVESYYGAQLTTSLHWLKHRHETTIQMELHHDDEKVRERDPDLK